MSQITSKVDARYYPPKEKHQVIFETFYELNIGEAMELTNDHDPKPLYYQFLAEIPNQFVWNYIQNGPEVWKVLIEKK